jgi:hypothetical protein
MGDADWLVDRFGNRLEDISLLDVVAVEVWL